MYIVFDPDTCMYPNCFEENIKSHAISRSYSLKSISEEHHLYHFSPRQFSRDKKEPSFKKISTLKATAHNGFCKVHDDIFQSLDTREILTSKDIILQVYRSLCVLINQEKSAAINLYALNSLDSYKKISKEDAIWFLKSKGELNLIPSLDDEKVLDVVRKKIHFLLSESIDDDFMEIERLSDYLIHIWQFNYDISIPVGEFQTLTTENMNHTIYYYKTNFQIPVSVNGIHYGDMGGKLIKTYSIVVPYKNGNIVMGIIPNEILSDTRIVEKINDYFSSDLRVIEYVESIISTCDGWYIKPSVIENMAEDKREFFCQDCMFINERKLFDNYDFSIFDEIKSDIVNEKVMLNDNVSHIPLREDYDTRYERMICSMFGRKGI